MNDKMDNPCLQFNCSACCDPVKMKKGFKERVGKDFSKLPFAKRKEIIIPEATDIELETYDCKLLDKNSGKCNDYENRPEICRKTFCKAFEADNKDEQEEIINKIKQEKYFVWGKK